MLVHFLSRFVHVLSIVNIVVVAQQTVVTDSLKPRFLQEPSQLVSARQEQSSSSSSSSSSPLPREAKAISHPAVYRCGEIGKDLVANFVNRNYPENDITGEECRFRLVISGPHVCQVRLDFVDTELISPTKGDCLSQTLEVFGSIWPTGIVPLCGRNNDQHFYLHLGSWSANSSWVDFRLTTVLTGRPYRFGVWLTQIDCSSFNVLKAPEGCTQYFLGEKGSFKTFNYEGLQYLNGNNYRICIRPGKGVCGVKYEALHGDFNVRKSILASREIHVKSGSGSTICGLDYLLIPEGRDSLQTLSTSRKSRLLFLRRPSRPSLIIVNSNPAPPATNRVPVAPATTAANVVPTTTTSTTTQQTIVKKVLKNKKELKIYNDRYCGGVLSPFGGETISKPIFARVRSNLITVQIYTASTVERKNSRRNSILNMTTGFRIFYSQLRDCEDSEMDLVNEPSISQLLQTFNINSHDYIPPLFRGDQAESPNGILTTEVVAAKNEDQGVTIKNETNNKEEQKNADLPKDEDSLWDYLDENVDSNEEPPEYADDLYDF